MVEDLELVLSDSMGRSVRFGASKALWLMAFQGRCLCLSKFMFSADQLFRIDNGSGSTSTDAAASSARCLLQHPGTW
jgi:lipid-A-disaccharide synthase-like uncharacterized protein